MSCIYCTGKNKEAGVAFPCLCDSFTHPLPLNIGTGLMDLPRQIATFPEFRRAMLNVLKSEEVEIIDKNNVRTLVKPLLDWRARDKDDPGVMLIEMWAYICDSLSFYDEVLANEAYLKTSRLRTHLRTLVALLGYLPRTAVSSTVQLAAFADGRLQVTLPVGTAFRSGAFDGNPPQVFELDSETFIHPLTNKWTIASPHLGKITKANPDAVLVAQKSEVKEEALLLLTDKNDPGQNGGVIVSKVEKHIGSDKQSYTRLSFTKPTILKAGTLLQNLRLLKPAQSAGLWTSVTATASVTSTTLTLAELNHGVKAGDFILVSYLTELRWFTVTGVADVTRQPMPDSEVNINGSKFKVPSITISVTQISLDASINSPFRKSPGSSDWNNNYRFGIRVYFGMQTAATIIDEPKTTLSSTDALHLGGFVETLVRWPSPQNFLLQDKNTLGASVDGSIDFGEKKFTLSQGVTWSQYLTSPVELYGNVLEASRGETVLNEKLGSGNASVPNQAFKLKKKPLTYHLSPTADNDNGTSTTLTVYVNSVKWTEVNSFFGRKETDQIYIVRQNDEGESLVIFGDGIRGERVPSGTDNVIANYRFGAGAAAPPAGSINQISKPIKGLQSVKNVLPASGGADAEPAENLRLYAPKSALILGRVVSLKDMEALAGAFPGVRAVQTEWRWNKLKQQASAHIFYIGEDGIASSLSQRLRNVSDPSVSITIEKAQPVLLTLSLNVAVDSRYLESDVVATIREALMNTRNGLLAPENIGIGQPLYRSKIFEAVLGQKGTTAVESIFLNGASFNAFAKTPGAGYYFDVEVGKLIINGKQN